jgi:hypothetical protein
VQDLKNELFRNIIVKSHLDTKGTRKGVVYTTIVGNYDYLTKHRYVDTSYDYVCFTDNDTLINIGRYDVWKIKKLANDNFESRRNCR